MVRCPSAAPRSTVTKRLLILGSTGSIGTQTLDLVREDRGSVLSVVGLAARSSWEAVLAQVMEFGPRFVSLEDEAAAEELRKRVPDTVAVFAGENGVLELIEAADFDVAIHGIVGAAGLLPSVGVLKKGRTLGLANKESLVIAGEMLMGLAGEKGAEIVPVDSEHSAVYQCLRGEDLGRVRRVHLTASGGPFRTKTAEQIQAATPELALNHPNWEMGPRVTVGSATLMNKALEVLELHHLFGLDADRIHVVVHPQSVVHSMVEFVDGSVMAQLGPPDMRGPIHYAIHHPNRAEASLQGFSFDVFANLTFEEPDRDRFPALDLGFRCVSEGGSSGAVLNAADEVAVEAFLAGEIPLHGIPELCSLALDSRPMDSPSATPSYESLRAADEWARSFARGSLGSLDSTRTHRATQGER